MFSIEYRPNDAHVMYWNGQDWVFNSLLAYDYPTIEKAQATLAYFIRKDRQYQDKLQIVELHNKTK